MSSQDGLRDGLIRVTPPIEASWPVVECEEYRDIISRNTWLCSARSSGRCDARPEDRCPCGTVSKAAPPPAKNHTEHKAFGPDGKTSYGVAPDVETSIRIIGGHYLTIAQVMVRAAEDEHGKYAKQVVSAACTGISRLEALSDLLATLDAMRAVVLGCCDRERYRPYDESCGCHSCCLLSCCNGPLHPAMEPK